MQDRMGSRTPRQSGKGFIAFLIALIVVGFIGNGLWKTFTIKSRADEVSDFVYETLRQAERRKLTEEEVRVEIVKKVTELRLPIDPEKDIEVTFADTRWRVHFEWDDPVVVPGYTHKLHFVVDKSWTRY